MHPHDPLYPPVSTATREGTSRQTMKSTFSIQHSAFRIPPLLPQLPPHPHPIPLHHHRHPNHPVINTQPQRLIPPSPRRAPAPVRKNMPPDGRRACSAAPCPVEPPQRPTPPPAWLPVFSRSTATREGTSRQT